MHSHRLFLTTGVVALECSDYDRQVGEVETSGQVVLCRECAQVLAAEEIVFLEDRCTKCEAEWSNDISAWRRNEPIDPEKSAEFDAAFGVVKPVLN